MSPRGAARLSFGLSAVDALCAILCASVGDGTCVAFALLSGVMLACGLYFLSLADKGE